MKRVVFIFALAISANLVFAQDTQTIPPPPTLQRLLIDVDVVFITKVECDSLVAHKKHCYNCVLIPYHKDEKGRRVPTDSTRLQRLYLYFDSFDKIR
jgi:hypothetical protein